MNLKEDKKIIKIYYKLFETQNIIGKYEILKGVKLMRKNISGNSPWEDIVGYSRAVRIGNIFEIAGTTAVRDGKPYAAGNAYEQTKYILENIKKVLEKEGLGLKNVIRTRMFVTDISKWEEYGKAHGEFFRDIKPVATMVEVSSLIDRELMIEIEVSAVVD